MIRIRYSSAPFAELEIEASNAEWLELRKRFHEFCNGQESAIEVFADLSFDPSPYQAVLSKLSVRKTANRFVLRVEGVILCLSGAERHLQMFAESFPWDVEHCSPIAYHVHFDRAGREDCISEESLDIVLALKR